MGQKFPSGQKQNMLTFLQCEFIVSVGRYLDTEQCGLLLSNEVEVTLRLTVSQPVRLGVLPLLEQVTRCYIYLSDNYFL
jgi:hypothetical protein